MTGARVNVRYSFVVPRDGPSSAVWAKTITLALRPGETKEEVLARARRVLEDAHDLVPAEAYPGFHVDTNYDDVDR